MFFPVGINGTIHPKGRVSCMFFALKECWLIVSRKLGFHWAGLAIKAQEPAQLHPWHGFGGQGKLVEEHLLHTTHLPQGWWPGVVPPGPIICCLKSRIIDSLGLEKTSKVIEQEQPNTTMFTTKGYLQEPHPHSFWTFPGCLEIFTW